MKLIKIAYVYGAEFSNLDYADEIADTVMRYLSDGHQVKLDFEHISFFSREAVKAIFQPLLKTFAADRLEAQLIVENCGQALLGTINQVIRNSPRHYSKQAA